MKLGVLEGAQIPLIPLYALHKFLLETPSPSSLKGHYKQHRRGLAKILGRGLTQEAHASIRLSSSPGAGGLAHHRGASGKLICACSAARGVRGGLGYKGEWWQRPAPGSRHSCTVASHLCSAGPHIPNFCPTPWGK